MKKASILIIILITIYSIFLLGEKYFGVSIRRHGAPVDCPISTNIEKVLGCIHLNYMKFDTYALDWNTNRSENYIHSRVNRLYQDTNMEFSQFPKIKACSDKNDCKIQLKEKSYRIDTYQDLIAYVRLQPDTQGFTYNKNNSFWNNLPLLKLWKFKRSYKFPYHDIVIAQQGSKYVFYVLSMEAVPLAGNYDLLIGSITAFCSEDRFATSKKYICGGYRFYFYDAINDDIKNFSLSVNTRKNPQYVFVKYGKASYKIKVK